MYRAIIRRLYTVGQQGSLFRSLFAALTSSPKMSGYASNAPSSGVTLEYLRFDNMVLRELPVDQSRDTSQRQVRGACFSIVSLTPIINPKTVIYSKDAMGLLGLLESELKRPEFADFFSGNRLLYGSEPAAHCYCGHQFGYFAGQLGDGAAMYVVVCFAIFIVRHYPSAVYAVICLSVYLCVCPLSIMPSVVSKQLNLVSRKQCNIVAL